MIQASLASPVEDKPAVAPVSHPIDIAPICIPEPMELSETPPDMEMLNMIVEETAIPQPPAISSLPGLSPPHHHQQSGRSPGKKRDKDKERDKEKEKEKDRDKEPSRKKSRKDSDREDSSRSSKKESSRSRRDKSKEHQPGGVMEAESAMTDGSKATVGDDDVVVLGSMAGHQSNQHGRPTMREAAKSMPRIPKLSQRAPLSSSSTTSSLPANSRDPRMLKQVQQGESYNSSNLAFFSLSLSGTPFSTHLGIPFGDTGGTGVGGGGGKMVNEDDVQVVADYRVPSRRSRNNNNKNSKRPPSPGIQGLLFVVPFPSINPFESY